MLNPYFVLVGVLAQFFGGASYFIDTLKGKIKPNRVSWFLWAFAAFVTFSAEIHQGVGIQSLTTLIVAVVPFSVFLASFVNKKTEWKIQKIDIICGTLSVTGLLLWYVTKVGNIAIVFGILADAFAFVPTLIKMYQYPQSENHFPFTAGIINGGLALLTIKVWNFQNFGYPLYLVLANGLFDLIMVFRLRKILKK